MIPNVNNSFLFEMKNLCLNKSSMQGNVKRTFTIFKIVLNTHNHLFGT